MLCTQVCLNKQLIGCLGMATRNKLDFLTIFVVAFFGCFLSKTFQIEYQMDKDGLAGSYIEAS